MSWTYHQSTGQMFRADGTLLTTGYAGGNIPPNFDPAAKNNPAYQDRHCVGPLPRGVYTLLPDHDDHHLGLCAIPLWPDSHNEMYGRGGFLIHADSVSHPGQASEGCIVIPSQAMRMVIAASKDRALEVLV
jgi:hypothetical protein